jgi:hypothetical protein
MPISRELDGELRAWLSFYTQQVGTLEGAFLLCPAKHAVHVTKDPVSGKFLRSPVSTDRLVPEEMVISYSPWSFFVMPSS